MTGAQSYDHEVQYEVRIRVNVNAKTPEEAAGEAQKLLAEFPVYAEVIDPRDGKTLINIGVVG
jgi:hypothetical protein